MTSETFVLPASSTQRRLWMLDRLSPGTPEYNIAWSVRLTGALRVAALTDALTWLTGRHETLRTTFTATDGEPSQVIHPPRPVRPAVTDLTHLPEPARARRLTELTDHEGRRPFDLSTGPLLHCHLVRTGAQEHLLILVVHHIVADGWSFGTFFAELGHAYGELAAGRTPHLPPPPIQYADFAAWQREQLTAGGFAADLEYWRQELTGAPALLELPADRPRPTEQSPEGGLVTFALPADLTARVRATAQAAGTSVFAVLLAGFQALLHRVTGQEDLLVAVPVSGRTRPETEQVVGFFANTLALRARFDTAPTFAALLAAARESAIAATARQEAPFEQLVDALNPPRSLAYAPLVQVMFALEEPPEPMRAGDVRMTPRLRENGTVKFDLTLTVEDRPEGLRGRLTYRRELFDVARMRGLAEAYRALLAGATERPDTPVAELPLLAPAAIESLLRRRDDAGDEVDLAPGAERLHLPGAEPPAGPDAVAVGTASGAALTYRQLEVRSNQLAQLLRADGAGPDVVVGICLPAGPDLVTAILATWKAGAGYLPLDPGLPAARIALMLDDARPAVVVSDASAAPSLPDDLPAGTRLVRLDSVDLAARPVTAPQVAAHPAALAYLLYTSGSTGTPKGVAVTRRSVANLLATTGRRLGLTPADRFAAITTAAFDISVVELVLPLLAGARIEIIDAATKLDAAALRAELAARGVTAVQATPTGWRMLATADGVPPTVRIRISGGEALPRDLADVLRAEDAVLLNGYGPTETTVYSSIGAVGTNGPVDLGDPVEGTRLYLLDPAGRPVPPGVIGELHIGGAGLARGYHGRAAMTADRFRPDPFGGRPGARLYATGDLARRLPGGTLEHLGRIDHQVKLRGYRIEPAEVEAALREQPEIADAVVTLWQDEDDARLAAHVVPAGAGTTSTGDAFSTEVDVAALWPGIRTALARRLPEYMIPATVVALPQLPRTASGKVDRAALPRPTWREAVNDRYVNPRDPVERSVAELWREVLGLERIGVHDNFFALGGHSLTATRLTARIRTEFGVELPLRSLFAAPTVAALAVLLTEAAAGATGPAERIAGPAGPDLLASLDTLSDQQIDELLDTLIAEEES